MDEKRPRGLGRGLDSLLSRMTPDAEGEDKGAIHTVRLAELDRNPFQPRKDFAPDEISDLAASIRRNGVLQPVVVRKAGERYQLISGERRTRAAREAALDEIPVVVREVDDAEMLTLALVENLQRQDLNPIEKAEGFRSLANRFGLTQEAIAEHVSMDRSSVANLMRLLELPASVKDRVSRGTITMGHARAVLGIGDAARQIEIAQLIEDKGLSVRQVERLVKAETAPPRKPQKPPQVRDLENRLRQRLGGKVEVRENNGRGRVVIHFANLDDLDRILGVIGVEES